MGRRFLSPLALCASLLLIGCNADSQEFSDAKISDAAHVKDGKVGGDPFCRVDEILNDAEEIRDASTAKHAAIIASAGGSIGVSVVPPFPDDCQRTVAKGLDKLDPKPKKE